jgi:excisionase family DNA binding protein
MTLKELGEQLRFSRRTIYKLLDDGEIPAIKIGNKWRFDRESVDSWLKQRSRGKKLRILVIDDEVAVLLLVSLSLPVMKLFLWKMAARGFLNSK